MGYLCPDVAFDHYLPKMLGYLADYNIPHDAALDRITSLLNPLLSDTKFPRKFGYLNQILDAVIKEIIVVRSDCHQLALNIVMKIFASMPLTHSRCLSAAYQEMMRKNDSAARPDYAKYLASLQKSQENEFAYHEMCKAMETRASDVLTRVLETLAAQEKPSKKDKANLVATNMGYLGKYICMNATDELFAVLAKQLCTFIQDQPRCNAVRELQALLKEFAERDPLGIALSIARYVYRALISKEEDSKLWTSPLAEQFKLSTPAICAKAAKLSVNPYLSKEHLHYYITLLNGVLM
jgi:hypothetical protein